MKLRSFIIAILAISLLSFPANTDNYEKKNNKSYQFQEDKKYRFNATQLVITQSNLVSQPVDVVVNAANESLIGSAGVAKAIQDAAGSQLIPYIQETFPVIKKSNTWDKVRCEIGDACITPSFDLQKHKIRNIIHVVGPDCREVYQAENKEKLLRSVYRKALQIAVDNNLRSIAFPAISTGIFGYDIHEATKVSIDEIIQFLKKHPIALDEIRFTVFKPNFSIYQRELDLRLSNQIAQTSK